MISRQYRAALRRVIESAGLADQVNQADSTEAVHFIERALGAIFGDGYRPFGTTRRACGRPDAHQPNASVARSPHVLGASPPEMGASNTDKASWHDRALGSLERMEDACNTVRKRAKRSV